jgi:hypothetical protein
MFFQKAIKIFQRILSKSHYTQSSERNEIRIIHPDHVILKEDDQDLTSHYLWERIELLLP